MCENLLLHSRASYIKQAARAAREKEETKSERTRQKATYNNFLLLLVWKKGQWSIKKHSCVENERRKKNFDSSAMWCSGWRCVDVKWKKKATLNGTIFNCNNIRSRAMWSEIHSRGSFGFTQPQQHTAASSTTRRWKNAIHKFKETNKKKERFWIEAF